MARKVAGSPNELEVGGGGMSLATELGELTKYFRRVSEEEFPAPGAPFEEDSIPENVGQLFVANLVAVRTLQEELHTVALRHRRNQTAFAGAKSAAAARHESHWRILRRVTDHGDDGANVQEARRTGPGFYERDAGCEEQYSATQSEGG